MSRNVRRLAGGALTGIALCLALPALAQTDEHSTAAPAAESHAVETAAPPPPAAVPAPAPAPAATVSPEARSAITPAPQALREGVQVKILSGARPTTSKGNGVDETALYYYAQQRDLERLEAEIKRLQRLHPGWQPPADLLTARPGGMGAIEQPLWDLYGKGRYAEMRSRIAQMKQENPGWEPSEALASALNDAEQRIRLKAASDNHQWQTVIDIARANPSLIGCQNTDNMWRLAEAYANSRGLEQAYDLYHRVVAECENPKERFATLQKANFWLPPEQMEALFALAQQRGLKPEDLDRLRRDQQRGFFARSLGVRECKPVPQDQIDNFQKATLANKDSDGAVVLGWYYYNCKKLSDAEDIFRKAMEWKPSPSAAQGLAYTLSSAGKQTEAVQLATDWYNRSPEMEQTYYDIVISALGGTQGVKATIDEALLAKFIEKVTAARSPSGAEGLGWYFFNRRDYRTSVTWFDKSIEWDKITEKRVEGLYLNLRQLRDTARMKTLRDQYATTYPNAFKGGTGVGGSGRGGGGPVGPSKAEIAYRGGDFAGCIAALDAARSQTAGNAMLRGWCLLGMNRPSEAQVSFAQVTKLSGQSVLPNAKGDSIYGQVLALMRMGQVDEAMQLAEDGPISASRMRDVQSEALAQRAARAFNRAQYEETLRLIAARSTIARDRRDLLTLRAWSLFHLGHLEESLALFEALDAQYATKDTREAIVVLKRAINPPNYR